MKIKLDQQHHVAQSRGKNEAPPWVQWIGYVMGGWSLLFAILHFAAAAEWTPSNDESLRLQPDPFAWRLCIAMRCVIGAVTGLALFQARKHWFPRWFMQASPLSGSALLVLHVLFSFWQDCFHWALAPRRPLGGGRRGRIGAHPAVGSIPAPLAHALLCLGGWRGVDLTCPLWLCGAWTGSSGHHHLGAGSAVGWRPHHATCRRTPYEVATVAPKIAQIVTKAAGTVAGA